MGHHSRRIKPNKLDLILPLIDYKKILGNYHSLQYDRDQSRANKSSAGSNHTTRSIITVVILILLLVVVCHHAEERGEGSGVFVVDRIVNI